MALGKIKADTLEHSTAGSVGTQYVVNGSAKAWVFFDTDTGADINGSLNISSLTDENLGRTTGSWTSSFGNANYSGVPHGPAGGTGHTTFGTQVTTIFGSRTTTAFGMSTYSETATAYKDSNVNDLVVFGDLA